MSGGRRNAVPVIELQPIINVTKVLAPGAITGLWSCPLSLVFWDVVSIRLVVVFARYVIILISRLCYSVGTK